MISRKATIQDKRKWNEVVNKSRNGTFYHTWEWKEVIERGLKGKAIPIVVEDDQNKLVGVLPFFVRNSLVDSKFDKYFSIISNKYQILWSPHPKLYGFGGPCVFSDTNGDKKNKIYDLMLNFVNFYVKNKKSIIDSWIYPYYSGLEQILIKNGYVKRRNKKTVIIGIEKDLEEICKGFKKQYRKDIRRSIKNGVMVLESENYVDDIDLFYNKFQKILIEWIIEQTHNNYGQVSNAIIPYSYFEAIRDILFPKKMARLFFAEYNGIKIGALINFYYKDTLFLGHTSVLRGEYNRLNAYKLLIWKSIVDGKEQGFKKLDLTGLSPDETCGQYRFKLGFNGEIMDIGEYKKMYRYKKFRRTKNDDKRRVV